MNNLFYGLGLAGLAGALNGKRAQCHCIIKCAVTPKERKQAMDAFEYARSAGDSTGAMLATARLSGRCYHEKWARVVKKATRGWKMKKTPRGWTIEP